MTAGLWGIWYDLAPTDSQRFLDWAHDLWLPHLRRQAGVRWAAHYRYAGGGAQMAAHPLQSCLQLLTVADERATPSTPWR